MKKMVIVCLVVLSLIVVACSSPRLADSGSRSVPDDTTALDSSLADQASSGVSDVDTLNNELDSADADKAAGELEKLNW